MNLSGVIQNINKEIAKIAAAQKINIREYMKRIAKIEGIEQVNMQVEFYLDNCKIPCPYNYFREIKDRQIKLERTVIAIDKIGARYETYGGKSDFLTQQQKDRFIAIPELILAPAAQDLFSPFVNDYCHESKIRPRVGVMTLFADAGKREETKRVFTAMEAVCIDMLCENYQKQNQKLTRVAGREPEKTYTEKSDQDFFEK